LAEININGFELLEVANDQPIQHHALPSRRTSPGCGACLCACLCGCCCGCALTTLVTVRLTIANATIVPRSL
jgi:hypothetical protein